MTQLQGIGQAAAPEQSSGSLRWRDQEGRQGLFQPYIVAGLSVNLWGRDIMQEMGVYLYSPSATVTQQMLDQGLLPAQGLGKQNQGITRPLILSPRSQRTGLGYF